MKTPTVSSATSSRRGQISLRSPTPRLPRSSGCSMQDLANPSASVHPKRFSTPRSLLKFSLMFGVATKRLEVSETFDICKARERGIDRNLAHRGKLFGNKFRSSPPLHRHPECFLNSFAHLTEKVTL